MLTEVWACVFSDVPGKPKGPLDIVDVYSDRAAVLWDRPDNDGGCPITHYVVEMKEAGNDWKKVKYCHGNKGVLCI